MYRVRYFRKVMSQHFSKSINFSIDDYNIGYLIKYFLDKYNSSLIRFKKCVNKSADFEDITDVGFFEDIVNKKCTGLLFPFTIYLQHDFESLIATKIVTDFTQFKIDYVLEIFTGLIDKNNNDIHNDAKKLYIKLTGMHFIITLANIFSLFKFINTNKLDIKSFIPLIRKKHFISSELFDKCLTLTGDYIMTDTNISFDNNERKALRLLFDKYLQLYEFITEHNIQQLTEFGQENPDFNAVVGKYFLNKTYLTTSYVYKYLIKIDFFYLCDIVANKLVSVKKNNFDIKHDIFSQDNLIIEI